MPTVLNGADEVAVEAFLKGKIALSDIADIVEKVLNSYNPLLHPNWEEIWEAHKWANEKGEFIIAKKAKG